MSCRGNLTYTATQALLGPPSVLAPGRAEINRRHIGALQHRMDDGSYHGAIGRQKRGNLTRVGWSRRCQVRPALGSQRNLSARGLNVGFREQAGHDNGPSISGAKTEQFSGNSLCIHQSEIGKRITPAAGTVKPWKVASDAP